MSPTKRFLFLIAACTFIALGVAGGLLNIAWTYMYEHFNVTVGAVGLLLGFGTTGGLIAAFSSGSLIGKYGMGRLVLLSLLIVAIGLLGIGMSPIWMVLLGIYFFTSLGKGMLDSGLNSFISENYGTSAMNWLHACWGIGLTIAPFIMTFILLNLELTWRAGYFFVAIFVFLLGLLVLFTLKQWRVSPEDSESDEESVVVRATAREAIREPAVLWSVLFFFLYGGTEIGTGQLVNTLFVDGRGISQETAGLWLSMYWGSFTIGRMFLGAIALRVNDKILLRGSFVCMLIGAFLLSTNWFPSINMIALVLMGLGLAGIFPTLISQTPARVGRRFSAQSIGFQVGFAGLGGAVVSGIIGFFGERVSLEAIGYGLFISALLSVIVYSLLLRWYPLKHKLPAR